GDANGLLELVEAEVVVDGHQCLAAGEARAEERNILIREYIADVVEEAEPGAVAPLLRHGQQDLRLRDRLDVAAVGATEIVLRAQPALAETADRIRAAGEVLAIRGQRRRVAERAPISELGIDHQREAAPDRNELQIVVARVPELDVASRQRVAEVEAMAHTAIGEQRAVARIVTPPQIELVRVEAAADDVGFELVVAVAIRHRLEAAHSRLAVVPEPVEHLHRAAALGTEELGVLG